MTDSMMEAEQLLDALDEDQRRVAQQVRGPMAVLAGAGTGKTRAITYRIAYGAATGAYDPVSVLAVTFTQRAAAEMRQRLRDLGVAAAQARTFHSAALRQLTYFWETGFGGRRPDLIEHKASLVASAAARCGIRADKTTVRDLAAEIEWSKVSIVDAERYAPVARRQGRIPPAGLEHSEFARLFDAYEEAKMDRAVIDFEDVLILMCGLMETREDIARHIRSQYRNFVVDEYQDVSALQQRLLDLWLGERHDVCVVGDVAQTIYSFAGADASYLARFAQRHPGTRVVELTRDYRSTPQIVSIANRVMERAGRSRLSAGTAASGASGDGSGARPSTGAMAGAVRLVSQRPSGAAVAFRTYSDDMEEAAGVAQRIAALVKSRDASLHSCAILYRTNSQSEVLETALSQAGLSFVVQGGKRFFEREEIKRAMLVLRREATALRRHEDGDTTDGANDGADRAHAPDSVDAGGDTGLVDTVKEQLALVGWSPDAPQIAGAERERWDNLNALISLAEERAHLTLPKFVDELGERSVAQAAPTVDGVTLSTLHAAKGLEWDNVFLVGASEGLLPISLAATAQAREEERRLLYVGLTRARDRLEVSWARSRGTGRSHKNRSRTSLLDGIWPREDESARSASRSRARSSQPRRKADDMEAFEHEFGLQAVAAFEALKHWRLEQAHAQSKPAFTVFVDSTLRDIASARPKTLRQLGVIRGVGPVKLDAYGPQILAILRGLDDAESDGASK